MGELQGRGRGGALAPSQGGQGASAGRRGGGAWRAGAGPGRSAGSGSARPAGLSDLERLRGRGRGRGRVGPGGKGGAGESSRPGRAGVEPSGPRSAHGRSARARSPGSLLGNGDPAAGDARALHEARSLGKRGWRRAAAWE